MVDSVKWFVVAIALSISCLSTQAQVVVIPLGIDTVPLQNIITVSKESGDFVDPVEAMESITDADDNNRYLLVVGPGVYTLTESMVMREYVDIVGSGRNATKLVGGVSGVERVASAIVQGSDHASLRSMAIENTGGGEYSLGIYNHISSPILTDLSIKVSGANKVYAIRNVESSPKISNVAIDSFGAGIDAYGVVNLEASAVDIRNVFIQVSGDPTNSNTGIYNRSSSAFITNTSIDVSTTTGRFAWGVQNVSASPDISNVSIKTNGGSVNSYGITNENSSSPALVSISIQTTAPSASTAVYNQDSSSPTISNLSIRMQGGGTTNGINNIKESHPMVSNTNIEIAVGTGNTFGIRNIQSSSVTVSDSRIDVIGGNASFGVLNGAPFQSYTDYSFALIDGSTISGTTTSVLAEDGSGDFETIISHSVLEGSISGDPVCAFSSLSDGTELNSTCSGRAIGFP